MSLRRTSLRRTSLSLVCAGALASALLAGGIPSAGAATSDSGANSLKQLAKPTGVRVGTAVDTTALANDATYSKAVAAQFSTVTPENVMKWEVVEPQRGKLDFTEADKLVAFAKAHKQKVRGHTLVWHSQLPAWLSSGLADGTINNAQAKKILKQHIATEMGHFKGDIWAWDVVNEAFNEDGTLRDSPWLKAIGPNYIADAFRWAHKADPKAILFYNDYNTEGINAKSDAVYKLIKELRSKGVPVQGFGVQGHLSTQYGLPNDMQANLHRFAKLGLKTAVTEADVRITFSAQDPATPAEVQAQSNGYSYMLQSCLLERSCISFTFWGFTDKYSWVPNTFPGEGQANIYDENYQPKPAYEAVQRDLRLAKGIKKH
jgi:endo-1,4-beta-xylanase